MHPRHPLALLLLLAAAAAVLRPALRSLQAGQAPSFDRLSDADRKALGERFRREVWPLLQRGGEAGCVGCHKTGKIVSALRMTGEADRDYRMLLRDGFLLKGDAGSLLERITDPDPKRRMPPRKYPRWSDAETRVLRDFVEEVHKKQGR
jgi:hypothetical protein